MDHHLNVNCHQISCDLSRIANKPSSRTLQYGLENGGPAGLFYGYLVAWFGAGLQAMVMAEMASMYVVAVPVIPSGLE